MNIILSCHPPLHTLCQRSWREQKLQTNLHKQVVWSALALPVTEQLSDVLQTEVGCVLGEHHLAHSSLASHEWLEGLQRWQTHG